MLLGRVLVRWPATSVIHVPPNANVHEHSVIIQTIIESISKLEKYALQGQRTPRRMQVVAQYRRTARAAEVAQGPHGAGHHRCTRRIPVSVGDSPTKTENVPREYVKRQERAAMFQVSRAVYPSRRSCASGFFVHRHALRVLCFQV